MGDTKIEWADKTWHQKVAAKRIGVSLDEYLSRVALGQKWCTTCKEWDSRFIFAPDSSRGDGLAAGCRSRKPRALQTKEQKQEKARVSYRAYYARKGGPGIRERVYARKRGSEPIQPHHRESIMEDFDGRCAYCGATATTMDHVVPVSHGGGSGRGNLLPACRSCNSRKRTKPLERFLDECNRRGQSISDRICEELVMEFVL